MTTATALAAETFANLPGWAGDDHAAALAAFRRSGPQVRRIAPASPLATGCAHAETLAAAPADAAAARAFFEAHFTPHRVVHDGADGLLTGYYEPRLAGSRVPTAEFRIPVYRRPPDLVNLVAESARGAAGAGLTHARRTASRPLPYATRAEIEAGALAGQGLELCFFADPVDVYFMQVQGSGLVRLPDGGEIRLAYDGKNGHPYTSVGRHLIEQGIMSAEAMSLAALAAWLRAEPERGRRAMQVNRSYVFFRELSGEAARSALGVEEIPLTPGRSLAVDAGRHPIGTPVYVSAPGLAHAGGAGGSHRLMIAQDVGSAITGPERGDIYFGSGDAAGRLAGITRHRGTFHVLVPREREAA